jgi:CRISP-associated protein Cas1
VNLLNTLYVTTPESRLRLDNDTVRVELEEEARLRVPLHHLTSIVCFGHVGVSLPLMHRLAEDGIALVLLDGNGRFKARLEGPTAGNVLLRQAQHRSHADCAFAAVLARRIVAGKLKNQRHVLMRGARDSKSDADTAILTRAAQDLAASLRALPGTASMDAIRGVEGEAARTYFAATAALVRADEREAFTMDGRSRRPPRDRMNALLSFLYAMLMNDCRSACEAVGMDPQIGFLHTLRPGRASLALDLMEEFRPLADRVALTLVNRQQVRAREFELREGGAVQLSDDARKTILVAYQERKQEPVAHPLLAEPVPLGLTPLVQARLLARHLRGDAAEYVPFALR